MCVSRNKPLIMHKTGCILGEQIFLVPYSPKAWEERHELDTALNRVFFMLLCARSQPNLWCIHLKACCRSLCLMDTIDPGMTSTSSGVRFWCPSFSCTFGQGLCGQGPRAAVHKPGAWAVASLCMGASEPLAPRVSCTGVGTWRQPGRVAGSAGLTPRPARSRPPQHLHCHRGSGSLLLLQEEEKVSCRPIKHTQKLWTPLFTSTLSSVPFFKVSREMLSGYLNKNVILEWGCC